MIRILLLLFIAQYCFCQENDFEQYLATVKVTQSSMRTGFNQFDLRDKGFKGTPYLNEKWNKGVIYFDSGVESTKYPFKLDLTTHLLMIRDRDRLVDLPFHLVNSFEIEQFDFNNGKVTDRRKFIKIDTDDGFKFFELLADGKYQLLKLHKVSIKRAVYNAAMDVGSTQDEYVKKHKYYISHEGELKSVNKKKKKFAKELKSWRKVASKIKKMKTNPKDESSLIELINQVNLNNE